LLITIVLLSFLVLLLVSLAALTRVEIQVASNNQQIALARQNALVALNIAVGQLQKHAGPDQRITARADLEGGPTTPLAHWTGVYGSAIAADYARRPSEVATALIAPADLAASGTGSSARLLSWLVSGNENDAFRPSDHIGANGQITASAASLRSGLRFSPAVMVAGLTATSTVDSPLTIPDRDGTARPATLLVGPGSVRSALSGATPIDYVAAPLVDIRTPNSAIPGAAAAGGETRIGRYAWWVGDEGVKARVNLPLQTDDTRKAAAFAQSQRAAVELMDRANPSLPAPPLDAARISADYDTTTPIENIVTPRQLALSGAATPALANAAAFRFHDLTAHSHSVLADAYAGGLRRDLSALLATHNPPPGSPETDTSTLHTTEEPKGYTVPTWRHLRTHATTTVPASGADAGLLVPRLPAFNDPARPDDVGVYPVLSYVALGFRYASAAAPAEGVAINFNLYPLVVLWNPYTTPMKGTTYEVGINLPGTGRRVQLQMEDPALIDAAKPEAAWVVKETRDLRYAGLRLTAPIANDGIVRYFRFLVDCPELAPGESRVFTLPSSTSYTDGVVTPCTLPLAPGLNTDTFASMSGSVFGPGEASRRFRFVSSGAFMKTHLGTNPLWGRQLSSDTGNQGGFNIYLGAPRTTAPNIANLLETWQPELNTWYHSVQAPGHDGNAVVNPLQAPAPLAPASATDEPALKTFVTAVFSATGSNRTANKGTIPLLRWIAQSNIRAPLAFRSRRDPNYTTSYIGQVGTDSTMWPTWFAFDAPGDRASAGLGHDWDSSTNKPIDATLFEIRRSDQPLFSIGQLQHANLSLSGTYPAYAVGNSLADFRLPDLTRISTSDSHFSKEPPTPETHSPGARQLFYYDNSWLLNRALWDRYFFSTVPATDPGTGSLPTPLSNPRHVVHDPAKNRRDPAQAAAALLLAGGFNINSTSEQAWRAVLGGVNRLNFDPGQTGGPANTLGAALSRFARPTGNSNTPSGTSATIGPDLADLWQGYRVLSEPQIAQLARNIVSEIRTRGPFVSLADFINRRLVDNPNTTEDERLKGALQAALDTIALTTANTFALNDAASGTYWNVAAPFVRLPFGDSRTYQSLPAARGGVNDRPEAAHQRFAAFAPKFLTQADVLSTIGASLSARSDTFLVRTFGEALNPVTGVSVGRAWCEAVVQRVPDYVNPADAAESVPANTTNREFGRTFKIVSFRWLSPSDI
jgi:hypothetical protein